jgi:hypothetical protein
MSPDAIKAVLSPDSDSDLIVLLTFYDPVNTNTVLARICDGFTKRISETSEEVLYGVTSNGSDYIFLPVEVALPTEEEAQAPRASLVIHDVTRYLTATIRSLQGPPRIKMELVLSKSPDVVEVSFDYFYITSITYNRDNVTCELTMINLDREPFPVHSFTPPNFPGLF